MKSTFPSDDIHSDEEGTITGLENPQVQEPNVEAMAELYRGILEEIGEDVTREGLVKTPLRAASAMSFLTQGYRQSLDEILNNAIFEEDNNQMVLLRDIEFYSMCEHHCLPFFRQVSRRVYSQWQNRRRLENCAHCRYVCAPSASAGTHDAPDRAGHRRRVAADGRRRGGRRHAFVHGDARRAKTALNDDDFGNARRFSQRPDAHGNDDADSRRTLKLRLQVLAMHEFIKYGVRR